MADTLVKPLVVNIIYGSGGYNLWLPTHLKEADDDMVPYVTDHKHSTPEMGTGSSGRRINWRFDNKYHRVYHWI